MQHRIFQWAIATLAVVALAITATASATTLQDVHRRGYVECGVSTGLPGFSAPDENGNWSGLDVAFCRAVAAAVLGDAQAVHFTPLSAKQRFVALQSGSIDVLARNSTWTLTRDVQLGLDFVGIDFYDGQGFMVRKDLGIRHLEQLSGATICVIAGSTTELNLADYFRTHDLEYTPLTLNDSAQTIAAYSAGRCDVLTSDSSHLAALRSKLDQPSESIILPELISKEPLGPVVAQGDQQWSDIVQWTLFAWIRAEELGVNSDNVDAMLKSDNPKIRRLLGVSGDMGEKLGIANDWAYQIIKQVGNYGEVFRRTVGADSPLNLPRGVNALWTEGGLLYAMPIR